MPAYRQTNDATLAPGGGVANDGGQQVLETMVFENGEPVRTDGTTRVIAGGDQTNAQRVSSANGAGVPNGGQSGGVVMPWDDKPGKFMGDSIGKPTPH